jgi:hypothetical protein
MEFNEQSDEAGIRTDTVATSSYTTAIPGADILKKFGDDLEKENVTVPKKYVFILIAMLIVGGLAIFLTQPTLARIARSQSTRASDNDVISIGEQESVFRNFVLTLFDPLYFKIRHLKKNMAFAGNAAGNHSSPDLEIEFRNKEKAIKLAATTKFISKPEKGGRINLGRRESFKTLRRFADDGIMDVYLILGVGGKADDPRELYLIPVKEIDDVSISLKDLQYYRKWGMFFVNTERMRLI